MVGKARVACFLTCGYTEAGTMQAFLRKMNPVLDFKQYLPNKTKKKKGTPKDIAFRNNGLTGSGLLHKVYEIIRKYRTDISECAAILIEDDLDNRFYDWTDRQIEIYLADIRKSVNKAAECEIPVFILYAAPEIESWFVVDWKHGFGYLYEYSDIDFGIPREVRSYFTNRLKTFIKTEILKEYQNDIENYGMIEGTYVKLSDELKEGICQGVKLYIDNQPQKNRSYVEQILAARALKYSKADHGERMLREIIPEEIEKITYMRHFRRAYYEIHDFMKDG